VMQILSYSDIINTETFCYGDVLLRRRFVPETFSSYRRRFLTETFCYGDVLYGDVFVEETFCAETFSVCGIFLVI
jgi:hypothetical protein